MKKGFTLIELMIVILIIGIIATIGVPRFLRPSRRGIETFIMELNDLVGQAVMNAQRRSEPVRVFFSISGKRIELQTVAGKPIGGSLAIPPTVEVSNVIINGKSQFGVGSEKDFFYFLINQDGISQEVRLILKDLAVASRTPGGGQYEFLLNPFTSVFRLQ